MFKHLSDKFIVLLFVLVIVSISIVIAWFSSGWQLALLIAIVQLMIVFIARHVWMSDKSNFLLRALVLSIISGVVLISNNVWQMFVLNLFKKHYPNFIPPDYSVSPITLLFLLALATVVFHYTRDKSIIEKPDKKIKDLIEGPTIKQKWESICESLSNHIRDIDRATNWSHEYYTPLDAEVEIDTTNGSKKIVKDLLTAIKESEERLFLLIGDPGAGKSVALRKLCLDILKESVKKEYIPIYINLKEWVTTNNWSKTPPTWQDLEIFVKASLLEKDRYLADFFEQHYNVLDENGNLFFILDSFDEIPQVLGTSSDSKLIEDLSIVCREFLQGAKQKRSKGILASREFRMPRNEYFGAKTTLWIRPFNFEKIETCLKQNGKTPNIKIEQLLKERPELVPNLRSPFITSLFKAYLNNNNNNLPKNQADLFENYIHTSIEKAQLRLGQMEIPFDEILNVTIQIAKIIFSDVGLQAPLSILRKKISTPHFDSIIEILKYTRIARSDSNGIGQFSFAHRRFYEYFIVQDLLKSGVANLPLENIPTDSRWRDTLVLYCEVAPFSEAKRIANYCWFDVIQPTNNIRDYASRHCLRFLVEAFRAKKECLVDFEYELAKYLLNAIQNDNYMPDVKFASECIGILSDLNLDFVATEALSYKNSWINDTALRACRHLNSISINLENELNENIAPRHNYSFFAKELSLFKNSNTNMSQKELLTSLSLSEAFSKVKSKLEWLIIEEKINNYSIYLLYLGTILLYLVPVPFEAYIKYKEGVLPPDKPPRILIALFFSMFLTFFIIKPLIKEIIIRVFFKRKDLVKSLTFIQTITSFFKDNLMFWKMIIPGSLLILLMEFDTKNKTNFSLIALGLMFCLMIILFLFLMFRMTYNYFKLRIIYKNIDKSKCNQREYVYKIFIDLFPSSFAIKFLKYLEANIKVAYGSWPNEKFLHVRNGSWFIRMAKLEERWREAEGREAEISKKNKSC
jgi:NACHT domain